MPLDKKNYRGRFAPSPTGDVHFGTLIAAVGSYLQAKKNNGEWLVRIDDVDSTRVIKKSAEKILKTLHAFSFEWDGEVLYQSQQTKHYQQALDLLITQSSVFPCTCSRKTLSEANATVYPGTCRQRTLPEKEPHALRLLTEDIDIIFNDCVMGKQSQNIQQYCGDFVIKRRDGLFAYQLAVVVDDALQGINEIVRGADLLDSTPRQIYLQRLLGYETPQYCHLPLAVDASGNKISKSEGAIEIDLGNKEKHLVSVLDFLGQKPPGDLSLSSLDDIWQWAIKHWQITRVPKQLAIQV